MDKGWTDESMYVWMDEWREGRKMNGWMDGWIQMPGLRSTQVQTAYDFQEEITVFQE